jgi:hypothetical protein
VDKIATNFYTMISVPRAVPTTKETSEIGLGGACDSINCQLGELGPQGM